MVVCDLVLLAVLGLLLYFCASLLLFHVVKPRLQRRTMQSQGITGPAQPFLPAGDAVVSEMRMISHDLLRHVLPQHAQSFENGGGPYINWWTPEPRVVMKDPAVVKRVLLRKAEDFGKSPALAALSSDILHGTLFEARKESWSYQRHLLTPLFHPDNIKAMLKTMEASTECYLDKWELQVENGGGEAEVEVSEDFTEMTSDMIARTSFRSSFSQLKRIFELIGMLLALQADQMRFSWLPLARFLPTGTNIKRWKLRRELDKLVYDHIQKNSEQSNGGDLLDVVLAAMKRGDQYMTKPLAINICKAVLFMGHFSMVTLYCWLMFLLALHPEWQERARAEVNQVIKQDGGFQVKSLNKLKLVESVIRETLRLYPPLPLIPRQALRDIMVEDITIPEGMGVTISVVATHHDPMLWGEDANVFNPERFALGSATASKHPMGFMPFSFGGRACIGQNYALLQSKLVLAKILHHFEWSLSPKYRHNPVIAGSMYPKHGVPVVLKKKTL